jgi:flavin-dependent thymidylate synthase
MKISLLDHGYIELVETWGSDERIIEAARMSTDGAFKGWGPTDKDCGLCRGSGLSSPGYAHQSAPCDACRGSGKAPGDEKLLAFLWNNKHATPFEMAGLIIEVQAPIFVFREWHRHRTQCLGPDTLVHFDAPKSRPNRRFVYTMRIEDVWRKWQPTQRRERPQRQVNALWPRSRLQEMHLRSLDEEMREVGHTRIVDVIRGEPKAMVHVTTTSGRALTASRDHRVLTSIGWMTLGEAIAAGALLTLEGTTRSFAAGWEVPAPDPSKETWRPVVGWESVYEVSDAGRVRRHGCEPKRLVRAKTGYWVTALNRPGEQATRTVHSLVLEAFVGPRPVDCEARHKNHNRLDARLENLEWGTSRDNSADMLRADRQQRLVPIHEEIVTVEDAGIQESFDLAVEGPWHNFIAEGFVVHNSYNELSARYTPLPNLNYVPTVERLMINAGTSNKQAGTVKGSEQLTVERAEEFRRSLEYTYEYAEQVYKSALNAGVPKELARVHLPVGRYSRMRASANLRNWLAFLTLRMAPGAQWEIRQYANALGTIIAERFPRTWELFIEGAP